MDRMDSAMVQMREAKQRFDSISTGLGLKAHEADMDTFNTESTEGGAGHIMSFATNLIAPEEISSEKALAKEAEEAVEKKAFKEVEEASQQKIADEGKKMAKKAVAEDTPGIKSDVAHLPEEQAKATPLEAAKSAVGKVHDNLVEEDKKKQGAR